MKDLMNPGPKTTTTTTGRQKRTGVVYVYDVETIEKMEDNLQSSGTAARHQEKNCSHIIIDVIVLAIFFIISC